MAVSLAVCMAQMGVRVLLVDGDFRHPSVHGELRLGRRQGMVEYIQGGVELEAAVVRERVSGIDVLPMGRLAPNPTALVHSQSFLSRLNYLKEHYELVIIDSAPVLGIPETPVLSAMADQVVLVVKWGSTGRNAAKHAVRELVDAGAQLAGAVLTQVDVKRHARQGYGDAALSYSKYSRYYRN